MKRIGLLSDTHGWLDPAVLRHFEGCDEIWHAGDIGPSALVKQLENFKPLRAVYGNIDDHIVRGMCPEIQDFVCEDLKFLMVHIGGAPGRYAPPVRELLRQRQPAVFICGHSHLCVVQSVPAFNILHMNPGAAGSHGFHKVRTLLRFEVSNGRMSGLQVIELGPRTARL